MKQDVTAGRAKCLGVLAVTVLGLTACGDDSDAADAEPPAGDEASGALAGEPVEQFMHIHGLAIAPWSPDDVWLSTHYGLFVIDADGEWSYASDEAHDFMGFQVDPGEEGVVYTSGHPAPSSELDNPLGFMVSEDRGRTWETRSLHREVDFHVLAVQAADGDVVYGFDATGGRLLQSSDGGRDWQERALPHDQGVQNLAVHPTDAATVLAATPAGLKVSIDSAETWDDVLAGAPVTSVAYDSVDADRIVGFAAGPAGDGLVESVDGGETWRALGLDLGDEDVATHIAVHPADGEIIYVGTLDDHLYRSVDGGEEWEQLASHGVPEGEDA